MINSKMVFLENFFKNKNIDTPIYHYTRSPVADIIQSTGILRFTRFDCSSDSAEFRRGLHGMLKDLRRIGRVDPISRAIFSKYLSFLQNETRDPKIIYFMACFSHSCRSRHLWWHYGDKRLGNCLKFDFDQGEIDRVPTLLCRKVFYKRKLLRKWLFRMVRHYRETIVINVHQWAQTGKYESEMSNLLLEFHKDVFSIAAFYKRRKFRDESEYRMAIWTPTDDPRIKFENSKSFIEVSIPNSLKAKISY